MPTSTLRKSKNKKNLTKMVIPPTAVPGMVAYGSLFPAWVAKTGSEPVAIQVETDIPSTWTCDDCEEDAESETPCEHHTNVCSSCCDICWVCCGCELSKNGNVEGTCSSCEECDSCCKCKTCNTCGFAGPSDDFCSECEKCESDCFCESEHEDCDCPNCAPGSCGKEDCTCGSAKFGHSERPLRWSEAQEVTVRDEYTVDFGRFTTIEPAQCMADFYLLSYMETGDHLTNDQTNRCGAIDYRTAMAAFIDTVQVYKRELVRKVDDVFQLYVDIAVGGEVRHHKAIRHATGLSADRNAAWSEWLTIREQVGAEALLEAADLFMEMNDGGYGGERWALAAKVLYDRETGKLPDWNFVDRVFTMQHNNGSLLNKVQWAPYVGGLHGNGLDLMRVIGSAHHANPTDFIILQLTCSDEVRAMFRQWWKLRNKLLYALGQELLVFVPWQSKVTIGGHEIATSLGLLRLNHKWQLQRPPKPVHHIAKTWNISFTNSPVFSNSTADFYINQINQ